MNMNHMPFDQFQRYNDIKKILAIISEEEKGALTCLDVGGYHKDNQGNESLPGRAFIPEHRVFALDIADSSLPGYIRGNANYLPVRDNGFDIVFSCDVLEHIEQKEREAFIRNHIAASRHFSVIAGPFFSEKLVQAEKILYEYIGKVLQADHQQLKEHAVNGLPDPKEVKTYLDKQGISHVSFQSGSLFSWLPMMMLKHYLMAFPDLSELHSRLDCFFNACFDQGEFEDEGYRTVFVIAKKSSSIPVLDRIEKHFINQKTKIRQKEDTVAFLDKFNWLLNISIIRGWQELEQKNTEQNRLLKEREEQIRKLENELNKFSNTALQQTRKLLARLFRGKG